MIAAHVLRHAADRPHRLAVRGPGRSLTYAELAERAVAASPGLRRGELAAISLPDPVDALVAALAADLAGATPLLCDASWSPARRADVLATLRPARPAQESSWPVRLVQEPLPACRTARPDVDRQRPGDLAWACFTSGSTGRPRAVVRTRASWTGSFPHVDALTGIGPGDVVLVPGPLTASLYGFAAAHALAAGATAVLPGRWSPGDLGPEVTAVHLVPHQLGALPAAARPLRPGLVAIVGGAALHPAVRERASRAGIRVVSYYGATELSFVAADPDGGGLRPFPEVEIEVRHGGEVWARSPWLAAGYLGGAPGPMRRDADGWASVGDVAEPYTPGEPLRVRGRGDGAIQTGGATVLPEDVESVLRAVPGVADAVVVGVPHPELGEVVAAVVESWDGALSRAALDAVARERLDPVQRPRRWYAMRRLPRTPAGKPARAQVAARVAAGKDGLWRLR
ncbi:class I adenylate-forming enzyme family protein [Thermoactinospora rubra]|uniref:class I adenylate-forming enzyme family protein n=1 Tax=Thermoactinospora rubra TaxID=1088767 RepID=UPI000A107891|nr:AMP-binding protein [Thermoactinospora rubra]